MEHPNKSDHEMQVHEVPAQAIGDDLGQRKGKPRQCRRPSINDDPDYGPRLHKVKMARKAKRRNNWHKQRQAKPTKVKANLSTSHPNYGKHPREAYL